MTEGKEDPVEDALPRGSSITRRELLKRAGTTAALISIGAFPKHRASGGSEQSKSAILVYLHGGPSHIDLWDPKSDVPEAMRSPFRSIPTRVQRVEFTEILPRLAATNDLFTIIRSMSCQPCGLFFHDAAVHQMLTGRVAAHADQAGRLEDRRVLDISVIEQIEVSNEGRATSERYGRNKFGQQLLRARQLVESGERVVQVHWPWRAASDPFSWDVHDNLSENMRKYSGPVLDKGLSALFADLEQRGLLDRVLVVAAGEFGRSPKKGMSTSGNGNSLNGRDHWPYCYSVIIGGGGVKRGFVYGESDERGSLPVRDPVSPADLAATIRHVVGPVPPASLESGRVITGLFG